MSGSGEGLKLLPSYQEIELTYETAYQATSTRPGAPKTLQQHNPNKLCLELLKRPMLSCHLWEQLLRLAKSDVIACKTHLL
jgi:hypothetical protein